VGRNMKSPGRLPLAVSCKETTHHSTEAVALCVPHSMDAQLNKDNNNASHASQLGRCIPLVKAALSLLMIRVSGANVGV
jgi:hypothetical protein